MTVRTHADSDATWLLSDSMRNVRSVAGGDEPPSVLSDSLRAQLMAAGPLFVSV